MNNVHYVLDQWRVGESSTLIDLDSVSAGALRDLKEGARVTLDIRAVDSKGVEGNLGSLAFSLAGSRAVITFSITGSSSDFADRDI